MRDSRAILDYQTDAGIVSITKKCYDADRNMFLVDLKIVFDTRTFRFDPEYVQEDKYFTTFEFHTFPEFYEFLDGNLVDADLRSYDFEGIDLREYRIAGAVIHHEILEQQGLYDGTFFAKLKERTEEVENSITAQEEIIIHKDFYYPRPVEDNGYEQYDFRRIPFFYISDIHLCHRICNRFKDKATREEIYSYVKLIAIEILATIGIPLYRPYLLIAGDTSSDFEIAKVFYREILRYWKQSIVVISGNHELWDPYVEIEENIQAYRDFFQEVGITYLHNDLLIIKVIEEKMTHQIVGEKELLSLSEFEIREMIRQSPAAILGGTGFSGLNDEYNATNMLYGKSFETVAWEIAREKDRAESNRFDQLYRKLLSAIPKSRLLVLTHMRKEDWNEEPHNPKWTYLHGHTHRNYLEVSEDKEIFADNQIGYKSENIGLKYFYLDREYDVFAYYEEGIYEITKEQYLEFNVGKNIKMSFNRNRGTIYMLKKKDTYMFFIYCAFSKNMRGMKLYLLNGGQLCKLERYKPEDLQYYYDHLEDYADHVNQLMDIYTRGQERIAEFVKRLGGCGKTHGCIVDVDKPAMPGGYSYCHLFVNPLDGKVTPYFAYNVKSRYVYKDFMTMLEDKKSCAVLLNNYRILAKESAQNLPDIQYTNQVDEWGDELYVQDEESNIYKVSKIIRSLQYISENGVIRRWDEALLSDKLVDQVQNAENAAGVVADSLMIDDEWL